MTASSRTFAELDHVARSWVQDRDRAELDRMIDAIDRWWQLLSDTRASGDSGSG